MADELQFPVRQRGEQREAFLEDLRWGLRQMRDPKTGQRFTEDQIAIATAAHSEEWIRADGIDAVSFLNQQRALWMAAQSRPNRAAGITLRQEWSEVWGLPYLTASGGSGPVLTPCSGSTTFTGSTTIGDPAAVRGTDPAGSVYQVLFTSTAAPNATSIALELIAITTGDATNIDVDTPITWIDPPITAPSTGAKVTAKFTGGLGAETDAQFAPRLIRRIRHKPAAGNRAQVHEWSFVAAQNAVDRAWIYGSAFHAGSVLVAIAQKRGSIAGPLARVPSAGTMALITAYYQTVIPVVPGEPFVLAVPIVPVPSDIVLSLAMATDSASGFADPTPWPTLFSGGASSITVLTNQTHFLISGGSVPPDDIVPKIMVWDDATSSFEQLSVLSVTLSSPNVYAVVLAGAPVKTLFVGDLISPWTAQAPLLASTFTAYADSLGAGEVVDVSAGSPDDRAGFAFRWPKPNEEDPALAGTGIGSFLQDALGPSLANVGIESISVTSPPIPDDPADGPGLIVLGKMAVYSR